MDSLDEALDTQPTQPGNSPQPAIEVSLIDLVLAATDLSEDESEINDGIASLIQSAEVAILPRNRDPMQHSACETAPANRLPALYPLAS